MSVTGDSWLSINLAQLFPELDPNNPGSFTSLGRDKINQTEQDLQDTLNSVNNSLLKAAALINHVKTASSAIKLAQASFLDLVNNAANTGVYTHFLGVCPDFPRSLLKGPSDVVAKVASLMNDNSDPCLPRFVGDTAYIGGFLLLVGGPNPQDVWNKLKVFAEIFPLLKSVIKDGENRLDAATAEFKGLFDFFKDSGDQFKKDQSDYDAFKKSLANEGKNPFFNNPFKFNGCDKWICARIKDLIPAFDPNLAGSPLNSALKFESELVDGVTGAMDQVSSLSNTLFQLIDTINTLQNDISNLKSSLFDFAANLAATGIYFHAIGRDLTLTNNDMFVNAVAEAINDNSDPGRPKFRGNTACMAGVLMVVGAPNPTGLEKQLKNVGKVFKAFGAKATDLTNSLSDIKDNSQKVYKDLTTLGGSNGSVRRKGTGGNPPAALTAEERAANAKANVVVGKVPQFKFVNGVLVAEEVSVEFSIVNPSQATVTSDGSGTPPGQVTPVAGENSTAASSATDPTCDPNSPVENTGTTSTQVAKTSEVGESIREARRRVSDIKKL